jgi:hypothetical protein
MDPSRHTAEVVRYGLAFVAAVLVAFLHLYPVRPRSRQRVASIAMLLMLAVFVLWFL